MLKKEKKKKVGEGERKEEKRKRLLLPICTRALTKPLLPLCLAEADAAFNSKRLHVIPRNILPSCHLAGVRTRKNGTPLRLEKFKIPPGYLKESRVINLIKKMNK